MLKSCLEKDLILNTTIHIVLRDYRFLDFNDSLLGTTKSSLCSG
jgi:hypothetical protein